MIVAPRGSYARAGSQRAIGDAREGKGRLNASSSYSDSPKKSLNVLLIFRNGDEMWET